MARVLLRFSAALATLVLSTFVAAQEPPSAEPPTAPQVPPAGDASAATDPESGSLSVDDVIPPRPVHAPLAERPPGLTERDAAVRFTLLVGEEGRVSEILLTQGINEEADRAAEAALTQWVFSPATRAGQPLAVRVSVDVGFSPLEQPLEEKPPEEASLPPPQEAAVAATPGTEIAHDHSGPDESDSHLQVTVHGNRAPRRERRGASDYFLHRELLEAAPHNEGADILRASPGLFLGRSEGMAVAHSLSLRGFDSEHGQDIALSVGGLPINLPSHIHGQGYADLGFLVAGSVDQLIVKEGVRDPTQGDFAVAGSIDIGLGVDQAHRGLQSRTTYGSFNSFSQRVVWAPKEAQRESLGAAELKTSSGFGKNRGGQAGSGVIQHRFGRGPVTFRVIGLAYGASGASAGVVRQDDVDAGTVCFSCVYDTATARAQGTLAQRAMAGVFADYTGPEHASGSVGVWLGQDHFRSKSNFTGYTQRSQLLPTVSGRGDLYEQVNDTTSLGITGRYRTEAFEPAPWSHGTFEVGLDARLDTITQSQNLIDAAVNNQIWDRRVDASISQGEVSLWGDIDWQFGEKWSARLGARASVMSFDVLDRLLNVASADRPADAFLPGYRRSALGMFFGPRASLEFKPLSALSVLASYGEGYRSPQARTLQDGDQTPFARARSVDLGARYRAGEPLELSATAFFTHMEDDVSFDPLESRLERVGPTSRLGATAYAVSRLQDWLIVSLSATYVHATLLDAPPPTAEDPSPPFEPGQLLPSVAPLTLRLDGRAVQPLLPLGPHQLKVEVQAGASYLSERPLRYGSWSSPVGLLDAGLSFLWGPVDLGISAFNLLNQRYQNEAFQFVSNWDPANPPSRVPAQHIAAGPPLSFVGHLGLTL